MHRRLIGFLALLAFVPAVWALAAPAEKPQPDAPAAEAYKALVMEYQKAQQELVKQFQAAKTDEEREKIRSDYMKLGGTFAGRFLDFAQKNAKEPQAVDALVWILTNTPTAPEAAKAVDLLVQNHLKDPKLTALTFRLARSPSPAGEKLLRALVEKGVDRNQQGQAALALADNLKSQAEVVRQLKNADEAIRKRLEAMHGSETVKHFRAADADKLEQEAEKFYELVIEKYSDVKSGRTTLGETAKRQLHELRHLGIGKPAPEIEGEDIDGKKFKLSDYRGKVVLLDFWGHW
jgi:hypothetical protein